MTDITPSLPFEEFPPPPPPYDDEFPGPDDEETPPPPPEDEEIIIEEKEDPWQGSKLALVPNLVEKYGLNQLNDQANEVAVEAQAYINDVEEKAGYLSSLSWSFDKTLARYKLKFKKIWEQELIALEKINQTLDDEPIRHYIKITQEHLKKIPITADFYNPRKNHLGQEEGVEGNRVWTRQDIDDYNDEMRHIRGF